MNTVTTQWNAGRQCVISWRHWPPLAKSRTGEDYQKYISIVVRNTHDDVIRWKHYLRYWPFVRGIHRSPVNSPHKGPATRSFDVFFDLNPNKQLSKQSSRWWFETPLHSLWRHSNIHVVRRELVRSPRAFIHRQTYNIRRAKSPNLNATRLVLQLFLPNPLQPGVKSRMNM